MALIIKSLFAMFWVFSSSFLVYLIYIVMQTESDPSLRWAWMTMTGLTFIAASLLAYIVLSAQKDAPRAISAENDGITESDSIESSEYENT